MFGIVCLVFDFQVVIGFVVQIFVGQCVFGYDVVGVVDVIEYCDVVGVDLGVDVEFVLVEFVFGVEEGQ